ncbi:hypothetical protein Tco_0488518 [Tanacetum coccineum]
MLLSSTVDDLTLEGTNDAKGVILKDGGGKNPGAKSGLRRKQSLKHTSESKIEASISKTGQSEKDTQSSLAKDKSRSHPSPPTPVVGEMHKEAQQTVGGPTSLGDTSEEGTHPQLSSDTRSAFFTPDSPTDEPIIVSDESEEEEVSKDKDTEATCCRDKEKKGFHGKGFLRRLKVHVALIVYSMRLLDAYVDSGRTMNSNTLVTDYVSLKELGERSTSICDKLATDKVSLFAMGGRSNYIRDSFCNRSVTKEELEQSKVKAKAEVALMEAKPLYLDIHQLTELLVTSLKPKLSKLLTSHDYASCFPTKLKELSSKITGLSGEIKELKKHVRDMEIELHRDLKEIPTKLETFTSTISSLSSQVNDTLNRFATMVENASGATSMNVPSAGKATASPVEGEKNTKDAKVNLQKKLIDLVGIEVVEQYHIKKLLFDKYCEKMLKRKKSPKITNCEVLTKKGPITLKIYRKDGWVVISMWTIKVNGSWTAKSRNICNWCNVAMDLKEKFLSFEICHVKREYDNEADNQTNMDVNLDCKNDSKPLNLFMDLPYVLSNDLVR